MTAGKAAGTRVRVRETREGWRILRLESPDGLNRLSVAVLERLAAEAAGEESAGLVITGNERYFSVGADLEEIARLSGVAAWEFSQRGQRALGGIAGARRPVVAAIDGYCMGGGLDVALACAARICTPRAQFGHRGAALGLVTGWGGTWRLPRQVGPARSLEWMLAASVWDGEEALAAGLVGAIAGPEELLERAARICPGGDRKTTQAEAAPRARRGREAPEK